MIPIASILALMTAALVVLIHQLHPTPQPVAVPPTTVFSVPADVLAAMGAWEQGRGI